MKSVLHYAWLDISNIYCFTAIMKTTLDIPDSLLREVKARAARKGQTMRKFLIDAVQEKLYSESDADKSQIGWRSVFGKASVDVVEKVQSVIDEEFSKINQEDWK